MLLKLLGLLGLTDESLQLFEYPTLEAEYLGSDSFYFLCERSSAAELVDERGFEL